MHIIHVFITLYDLYVCTYRSILSIILNERRNHQKHLKTGVLTWASVNLLKLFTNLFTRRVGTTVFIKHSQSKVKQC